MNYSFFALALIALCITSLALVAMVLAFCYKQDKNVSLKNKAKANKDGISSELALDIDTKKKITSSSAKHWLFKIPKHKH